jgi:hypothetical protein
VTRKVLIHVEDPGAANWILPLLPALDARGVAVDLVAEGTAVDYLRTRGVMSFASQPSGETDFVLVGTAENLASHALSLIDAARARGVPCAAVVDQAANAEHRFRGATHDPMRHFPDWLFLPDTATAERFAALGAARERCIVVGNPHHDRVLAVGRAFEREGRAAIRRRLFPLVPDGQPIVVFVSEVGYVVNPQAEAWQAANGFAGRGTTRYRSAVILEEVLDACHALALPPYMVLRLHPKNSRDEFAAYAHELDAISEGGDPLALVYAGDLVIGMTSALLEEAAILGRPTLAVLPRAEECAWLAMVDDGRIPSVFSREQLRRALPDMLALANVSAPPRPSGAVERIADFILAKASSA